MHRMPSGRTRSGGTGFQQVPQIDVELYDGEEIEQDSQEQQRLSRRDRFRDTVQHVLRQSAFVAPRNATFLSAESSPALSDTTLVGEDYLALPIQQFDEVDLTDARGTYVDLVGYYGPQVIDNDATVSYSHSIKAGKGIEVRVESYPLALSPGGLYTDDRPQDYGYHGSEGLIEKPLPVSASPYDYKPAPLRWRFILIVLGGLVVFLALSELALHLLPDASHMNGSPSIFQNTSEVRKRSTLDDNAMDHNMTLPKHRTDKEVGSPTEGSSHTEVGSPTNINSPTQVNLPTRVDSTSKDKDQTITSVQSSATNEPASTTKVGNEHSSTTQPPVTKVTAPGNNPSQTTALTDTNNHGNEPTRTHSWHPSSTQQDTTIWQHDTTTRQQDTTTQQQDTTTKQHDMTTKQQDTTTQQITTTRQDTTIMQHTTTEQHTTSPTPNRPNGGDTSSPDYTTSSKSTQPENTLTLGNPGPPAPTSSKTTTTYDPPAPPQTTHTQDTTTLAVGGPSTNPWQGTHPDPITSTVDPTQDTTTSIVGTPLTNPWQGTHPGPTSIVDPPQDTKTSTVGTPLTDPWTGTHPDPTSLPPDGGQQPTSKDTDPHSTMSTPESGPTGTGGQPDATKPTGAEPTGSTHDIGLPGTSHTATPPSTFASPTVIGSIDQSSEPTSDAGSLATTTKLPTMTTVTFHQLPPSSDATAQTVKIYTSAISVSQADSPSTVMQLPPDSDQSLTHDTKPFTTIIMAQGTETPPPPITNVFTTSSSIAEGVFVEVTMTTTLFGHIKAAESLSEWATTTTYGNGTVSTITKKVFDELGPMTEYDADGKPTKTEWAHTLYHSQVTTLKNALGVPTATLGYYDVNITSTLYDNNHIATATVTMIVAETPAWTTLYDTHGKPIWTTMLLKPITTETEVVVATSTPTVSPSSNTQPTLKLHRISDGIYFAGLMLPTLLAILVSIPIRILSRTVKLYQGFHALASDRGASAAESLCLKTTGPSSFLDGLLSFQSGHYLLGLTSILVILSALTIPFSAEVLRLIIRGSECNANESGTLMCSVVLGVFPVPAQVLTALLIILIAGIIGVALVLRRWKTGLERNPWNISNMSQLAAGTDMRNILERLRRHRNPGKKVDNKEFVNKLRTKTFGLRDWEENGVMKYSVLILTQEVDDTAEKPFIKAGRTVAFVDPVNARRQRRIRWPRGDFIPFFMLSWTGRIMFLFLLSGVLIAVLTYDIVARGSEYQRGLTGKAVGVRFLFSGAGVLITFAWGSFFDAVAFLSPYKLLHRRRPNKGQAIHINPATNPFVGLWLAFIPSRRDVYLGVVAATAIISELLPLYLGNIPCNGVQIQSAEIICVYLSVAILSIMMLIIGSSFFVDWPPKMGVDPSTIAGAMYAAHVFSVEKPLKRFFKKEASSIV